VTDQPAIFIISRRVLDRHGKGHHAAVCIGETESIVKELKTHKRAKCTKQHGANVVCVLREQDVDARADAVEDITAARKFSCIRSSYTPTIETRHIAKRAVTPLVKAEVKTAAAKVARTKTAKAESNGKAAETPAVNAKTKTAKNASKAVVQQRREKVAAKVKLDIAKTADKAPKKALAKPANAAAQSVKK
jgi:hypothetical protein